MNTLAEYFVFVQKRPELFVNPPQNGFTILLSEEEILQVEQFMEKKLEAKGLPSSWARVGIVYRDQNGMILRDAVRFPNETLGTYIRFVPYENALPGVLILPVYQEHLLLVHRFRHATRTWHLEFPIELGKTGLSSEENARQKLMEDMQATVSRCQSIGTIEEGPGVAGSSLELFLAEVESYSTGNEHIGIREVLQVKAVEFESMLCDAKVTDAFTAVAYLYAKLANLL